jgi:hypothetical protein
LAIKELNGSLEIKEKRIDKLLNYKVVPSQSSSVKKPSYADQVLITNENEERMPSHNSKLMKPDPMIVKKLLVEEGDERFKYLLKHGIIHFIESGTMSLYVELPQVPNIIIIYRRPSERSKHPYVINLTGKGLLHVPLLEGEEATKEIILKSN